LRAEIRRLHSPDLFDLRHDSPTPPDDFSVLIQILVGPAGGPGEESFDVLVVTPKYLARRVAQQGPVCGRHLLVVESFDYASIEEWIRRAVHSCEGSTWSEVALRIARIGHWEFEDYTE
jgi:hypothetical protein